MSCEHMEDPPPADGDLNLNASFKKYVKFINQIAKRWES